MWCAAQDKCAPAERRARGRAFKRYTAGTFATGILMIAVLIVSIRQSCKPRVQNRLSRSSANTLAACVAVIGLSVLAPPVLAQAAQSQAGSAVQAGASLETQLAAI